MTIAIRPVQSSNIEAIQTVAERAWYSAHAPIIGSETVEGFLDEYYDAGSFQSRIDAAQSSLILHRTRGATLVGTSWQARPKKRTQRSVLVISM